MAVRAMWVWVLSAMFVAGCVQTTVCVGGAEEIDGACVLPDGAVADSGSEDGGAVDSGTGMDSGVVTDSGSDAGRDYRFVFATSAMQHSNYGGRDGADTVCNDLADDAGLSRTYVAWLSTAGSGELNPNAADRVTDPAGGWRLVGTPVAIVAMSKTQLLNGSIDHAIDRDESGVEISSGNPDDFRVATATLQDGGVAGTGTQDTCENWRSSSMDLNVMTGRTNEAGFRWTERGISTCSRPVRLYCFEI